MSHHRLQVFVIERPDLMINCGYRALSPLSAWASLHGMIEIYHRISLALLRDCLEFSVSVATWYLVN